MKITGKKAIIILVATLVMTTCIGCVFNTPARNRKRLLAYMKEKYNEDFEYYSSGSELFGSTYVEIWVRNENLPDVDICVHMDRKTYEFTDNYICYLRQGELDSYISEIFKEVYGPNKVFGMIPSNIVELMPFEISKEATIEEYAKAVNPKIIYQIYIYSDEKTKNEDIRKLENILFDNKCQLDFTLYYVKEYSLIENMTAKDTQSYKWNKENVDFFNFFMMDSSYRYMDFDESKEWRQN